MKSRRYLHAGFSLIELMVAMSLFVLISSVAFVAVGNGQLIQSANLERGQAQGLAEQGIHVARYIANQNFSALVPGTYGLTQTPGDWQLSPTTDSWNGFTRAITISAVNRDTNGTIVESGGTLDPATLQVTSTVNWQAEISNTSKEIALREYIMHWSKPISVGGSDLWSRVCGTQGSSGAELSRNTPQLLVWSENILNPSIYSFTPAEPSKLTFLEPGDYQIIFNHPIERTDNRSRLFRLQSTLLHNGTAVSGALSRSALITRTSNHTESSNQFVYLLRNVQATDFISVQSAITNTYENPIRANTSGAFCLFVKKIAPTEIVFSATSTAGMASTNLNNTTYTAMQWTPDRADVGFTHNAGTAQNVTLTEAGLYQVFINVPMQGTVTSGNVRGEVMLDGVNVATGRFSQGNIRNTNGDSVTSIHWFGVVSATAGQNLNFRFIREAAAGTITMSTNPATLLVKKIPSEKLFVATGTDITTGTNWNAVATGQILWSAQQQIDASVFAHSISSNAQTITVNEAGDYLVTVHTNLTSAAGTPNVRMSVLVNGVVRPGAQVKTHVISGSSGHAESSGTLSFVLTGLQANDQISIQTEREADTDTVNDSTPTQLVIVKQ